MIAFRDKLPLIRLANGNSIAFDRDWLSRALSVAASQCGHTQWWLARHIAETVQQWMETLENQNIMPVAQLTRAIRTALQAVGYGEIGERFEAAAPFSKISLADIAIEAGNGFELAFFQTLQRKLNEIIALGSTYCEIHDLESCVKILRRSRIWGSRCDSLRAEIVHFTRKFANTAQSAAHPSSSELFLFLQ